MRRAGRGQALGQPGCPYTCRAGQSCGEQRPPPPSPQPGSCPYRARRCTSLHALPWPRSSCTASTHTQPLSRTKTRRWRHVPEASREWTQQQMCVAKCRPDPSDTGVNRNPETPEHRRAGTVTQRSHSCAPVPRAPTHSHTHTTPHTPHCLLALRSEGLCEAEGKSIRPGTKMPGWLLREGASRNPLWL